MSFWEETKRPSTLIAAALLAISIIAGVATSFYFYKKSEKAGQLSYSIEQAQVFDKTKGGRLPLTILDVKGNKIEDNVFAANVTIWNIGNAEIKGEDVRDTFHLEMPSDIRLLDVSSLYFTRHNVDKFSVGSEGSISWEHFDPGEGLRVRVVYARAEQARIALAGYAAGAKEIINYNERADEMLSYQSLVRWFIMIVIVVLLSTTGLLLIFRAHFILTLTRPLIILVISGFGLSIVNLVLWTYFPPRPTPPPF